MKKIIGGGVAVAAGAAALFAGGVFDTSSNITPTPGPSPTASPSPSATGKFLHLSDIHFDPVHGLFPVSYQPGDKLPESVQELCDKPIDKWKGILDKYSSNSIATGNRVDSNWALLKSALSAAKDSGPYDYVLYTGDYLAHNFYSPCPASSQASDDSGESGKSAQDDFTVKTVDFVNAMLEDTFKGKPIVSALGNNDSGLGDYNTQPGGRFLNGIAPRMPEIAGDKTKEDNFAKNGFYRISDPALPHDFLVMGIFWSRNYKGSCDSNLQPGKDQMAWLKTELKSASSNTILLMHIPPGIDGYNAYDKYANGKSYKQLPLWCDKGEFETNFAKAIGAASSGVTAAFAGHTHMDEFRVVSDDSDNPMVSVRMNPSISPHNGNHPAFSIVQYDTTSGAINDYTSVALTNGGDAPDPASANWAALYSFQAAYGVSDYSPATMQTLGRKIQNYGTDEQKTFGEYYASGARTPAARENGFKYFACAQTEMDEDAFKSCIGVK